MDDEPGGPRRNRLVAAGAAAAVVLVAGAGGVSLVTGGGLPFLGGESPVEIRVTLTPDASGTLVEIVAESAEGALPSSVDLELPLVDDAEVTGPGAPATGKRLVYSDVRDGLGNPMPAEAVRSGKLTGVGTDGMRLQVNYHVALVDGRRIVYPIPLSSGLKWTAASLYADGATITCQGDNPPGSRTFAACSQGQESEIDGTRHTRLRLELTSS